MWLAKIYTDVASDKGPIQRIACMQAKGQGPKKPKTARLLRRSEGLALSCVGLLRRTALRLEHQGKRNKIHNVPAVAGPNAALCRLIQRGAPDGAGVVDTNMVQTACAVAQAK